MSTVDERPTIRLRPADVESALRTVLSAQTLTGNTVCNSRDEELGVIQDIMLDTRGGRISDPA